MTFSILITILYNISITVIQKERHNRKGQSYPMEFNNDKPIYIQIASILKAQIASGERHAGDKLPSVREGSILFEVSALTMQRVMQQLETEGIVISKKGVGYFIREECVGGLQARMAREKTGEFVREMKDCGLSLGAVYTLVEEQWEEMADEK